MCDNSIPITFVANNQFKECSFDSNVILEVNSWWKQCNNPRCTYSLYYFNNDERRILHAIPVVNYRGIDDSIAPQSQVGNCLFMMLSENFDDPYSLSNIAKTIRQSILRLCQPRILGPD